MRFRVLLCAIAIASRGSSFSSDNDDECRGLTNQLKYDSTLITEKQLHIIEKASTGEPAALHLIGKALQERTIFGEKDVGLSMSFFLCAAASGSQQSAFILGKLYHEGVEGRVERALGTAVQWYSVAMPHQAAMYNMGLIFAEGGDTVPRDIVSAIELFREAHLFNATHAKYDSSADVTAASKKAFDILLETYATNPTTLPFDSAVQLFKSCYIDNVDSNDANSEEDTREMLQLFTYGMKNMSRFNDTFIVTNGKIGDKALHFLTNAVKSLGNLIENYDEKLTVLQQYMCLDTIQEAIGPIAAKDEKLSPLAGRYAELYAMNPICYSRFAVKESDAACFNGAASAAMSYYRRGFDNDAAERMFSAAASHSQAATKWKYQSQTPRVYHNNLSGNPFWDPAKFELFHYIRENIFDYNSGRDLQNQLDAMIALSEGALRRGGSVLFEDASVDSSGGSREGLQRVFTPHIGVANSRDDMNSGGGPWAEFGPLFDGVNWNAKKCGVLTIICSGLRDYIAAKGATGNEICGSKTFATSSTVSVGADGSSPRQGDGGGNVTAIEEHCGSDTIVTVLRLRPGTHIKPHCGTTNRRLIMHFALRGSEDVEFRVGDDDAPSGDPKGGWRTYRGDGNALVFDDSFEHEVRHGGAADRFVLLIVLSHPQAP